MCIRFPLFVQFVVEYVSCVTSVVSGDCRFDMMLFSGKDVVECNGNSVVSGNPHTNR